MGSLGATYENNALDALLGDGFTPPANVYVALYTVQPTSAGGGTEIATGSYARVMMTNDGTSWPAASSGLKSNGIDITFPTASADWGAITSFAIHDDPTADSLITWGLLSSPTTILMTDTPKFLAGTLTVAAS